MILYGSPPCNLGCIVNIFGEYMQITRSLGMFILFVNDFVCLIWKPHVLCSLMLNPCREAKYIADQENYTHSAWVHVQISG